MKNFMNWKDSYALGVPEVDRDHRELIEMLNTLHGALLGGAAGEDVHGFLSGVRARVADHFALEERLMQRNAYPEYEVHKRDHERLLADIVDIVDRSRGFDTVAPDLLGVQLEEWFATHFRTHDAQLHGLRP
ncbi:MAG: hemerythrin family protein [Proteobacteria bacterium]|nr:hemerythrin family protein [Pseudomonadota bacterium]